MPDTHYALRLNDLWVRARIDRRGDYLAVTGDLVNLRPDQDRAVILYFLLPTDGAGARWGRNLGVEELVQPGRRYLNPTYFHQAYRPAMSRLPIATLSGPGWGLSMVQPMDVPRFFRIAYQPPYGLQIEYEFGLSPVTWKFPRAYVPLYNALGAAGWQPVPYARISPPDAWCERFGAARRGYFFAIRNPGPARALTLSLDRKALGLAKPAFTAITGCHILGSDAAHVRLAVPAQWTAVLAVNRSEARELATAHRRELARFRQ